MLDRLQPRAMPTYNRLLSANLFHERAQAHYEGGVGAHNEERLSIQRSGNPSFMRVSGRLWHVLFSQIYFFNQ